MTIRKKHTCFECQFELPASKLRSFNGFRICRDCWNESAYSYWDLFGDPVGKLVVASMKKEITMLRQMLAHHPERDGVDVSQLEARLEKVRKELAEAEK